MKTSTHHPSAGLHTLFQKFDQLADVPVAVGKIRELILRLAVHGKLVPQDPKDEPASELLKEIRLTRSREAAKGKARKINELPPIKPEEIPYQLPNGWEWVRLGEVGVWKSGTTPSRTNHEYYGGNIPWVKSGEVKQGQINNTEEFITEIALKECSLSLNTKGSVLVAMYGANIGEVGILGIDATTNQAVCACQAHSQIEAHYLLNLISAFKPYFISQGAGAAQPNISREKIVATPFPLPPLAEQKRIVAKVDELMAQCDRLEEQLKERGTKQATLARATLSRFAESPTPENLELLFHNSFAVSPADLRKTILSLAVQGKLVPHDAESTDWKLRKLKDLAKKIGSGSTPSGGKESYQESGIPLIRSMNVHFAGFVRKGLVFLNEDQAEKLRNVIVKTDDVLLNITGASIGRVTTAPTEMDGARVNQHVCIIRPTSEILPVFMQLFLSSPVVQNLIDDVQVGATREALTKAMIEQFEVPIPPLAEQHRIVAKVDQLMALVDKLEAQLASSRSNAEKLMEAAVAQVTA